MDVIEEIVNMKRLKEEKSTGLFILTGSQTFQLMRGITQSMAGRAAILNMEPLSRNELLEKEEIPFLPSPQKLNDTSKENVSIEQLYKTIITGFYPEIYHNDNMSSSMFYSRYVSTYLDRDINELINIKDKNRFHNFMQVLASLTGQQLNVHQLSKIIGVSAPTIKDWISVLETSGLIYFLQSYQDISVVKRVVKSPKVYFSDTGLASYLAKINDAATL